MPRTLNLILGFVTFVIAGFHPAVATVHAADTAQFGCANAFVTKHDPSGAGTRAMWEPGSSKNWRLVNFWTNWPGVDQVERKLSLLAPGQDVKLLGGGTVYEWLAQCEGQARDGFNSNPLNEVTPDQLGAQEWLCCDEVVFSQWDAYWNQSSSTPATVAAQTEGCPPAREIKADFPQDVEVIAPAIAKPWWNDGRTPADWGQKQTQSAFRDGQRTTFIHVMGRFYLYEDTQACRDRLDSELANDSLPRKDASEYRSTPNLTR